MGRTKNNGKDNDNKRKQSQSKSNADSVAVNDGVATIAAPAYENSDEEGDANQEGGWLSSGWNLLKSITNYATWNTKEAEEENEASENEVLEEQDLETKTLESKVPKNESTDEVSQKTVVSSQATSLDKGEASNEDEQIKRNKKKEKRKARQRRKKEQEKAKKDADAKATPSTATDVNTDEAPAPKKNQSKPSKKQQKSEDSDDDYTTVEKKKRDRRPVQNRVKDKISAGRRMQGRFCWGDTFDNREKRLPTIEGLTYTKYDVDAPDHEGNRGVRRIVVSSTGNYYFTENHYKTFTKI